MAVQLRIQLKGDTAENWTSKNTVLLKNELGYDSTTNRIKFGNGVTAWNDLLYVAPDVINDLITGGTATALSAEQGKILKALIDDKADKTELSTLIEQVRDSIKTVDIIDDLETGRTDAALSANQGIKLKELVDSKPDSTEVDDKLAEKLNADSVTHETWVFTLEDESIVDKEVVLWNS